MLVTSTDASFQIFIAAQVAKLGAADVIVVGLQASARFLSVTAPSCCVLLRLFELAVALPLKNSR